MKKRFPALFLSAAMVFSLPALPAGAAETEDGYEGILEEYADTSAASSTGSTPRKGTAMPRMPICC